MMHLRGMYNIVFFRELESAGVSTRTIRQAQKCCLLKLCSGVYTVILVCGDDSHHRIARFIEDTAWTDRHAPERRSRNFRMIITIGSCCADCGSSTIRGIVRTTRSGASLRLCSSWHSTVRNRLGTDLRRPPQTQFEDA